MNSKQQRPFVLIELKKRIAEQKINDVRCKEMHKILRKADNRALYRRMHLESSEEEIYMNIQRVYNFNLCKINVSSLIFYCKKGIDK